MRISLAVTLLLFASAISWLGTPHWLDNQECRTYDGGRTCAYIIRCDYVGVQGWWIIHPEWEPEVHPCPGIAWLPLRWPLFQWRNG